MNGSTPLHLAAEFGTLEVVQYMMENGAFREHEPNTHSPLHLAAYGGKLETVKYLDTAYSAVVVNDHIYPVPISFLTQKGHRNMQK